MSLYGGGRAKHSLLGPGEELCSVVQALIHKSSVVEAEHPSADLFQTQETSGKSSPLPHLDRGTLGDRAEPRARGHPLLPLPVCSFLCSPTVRRWRSEGDFVERLLLFHLLAGSGDAT